MFVCFNGRYIDVFITSLESNVVLMLFNKYFSYSLFWYLCYTFFLDQINDF